MLSGTLFVALGDGGGSRGRDAQDMAKLLGAILRIKPKLTEPGYDVPADNPFVGQANVAPEFWAKGLRNPWRFSIDTPTGDMWIGDVGEDDDRRDRRDARGSVGARTSVGTSSRAPVSGSSNAPGEMTPPVYEYPHSTGIAAYKVGTCTAAPPFPGSSGAYIFGDVNGTVWALGADGVVALPIRVDGTLSGFGMGPDGELYAQSLSRGIFKITPA